MNYIDVERIVLLILGALGIIEMMAIFWLGAKRGKLYAIIALIYFVFHTIYYALIVFFDIRSMVWSRHLRINGIITLTIIMTDYGIASIREQRKRKCLNGSIRPS